MSDEETKVKFAAFQFLVILHPTVKERKDGKRPEIIGDGVQTIVAKDGNEAVLRAARSIPDEHADKMDRLEVAVRPF